MNMIRTLTAGAWLLVGAAVVAVPAGAQAQTVNPYKPFVTRPPAPQDPSVINPAEPGLQGNSMGTITPPPNVSRMPVIHPTTPSRMPVIRPAGTPGGNPSVIPK
jgi:hypothetical protein